MAPYALLFTRPDPFPGIEDEFYDWYETDHIPERMAIPGFLAVRRYQRDEAPHYLTCYDVAELAVFDSDAYRGQTRIENGRRISTPWTQRMFKKLRSNDRRAYEQIFPGSEETRKDHPYVVLQSIADGDRDRLAAEVQIARAWPGVTARLFTGQAPRTEFEKRLAPKTRDLGRDRMIFYTAVDRQAAERCTVAAQAVPGSEVLVYGPVAPPSGRTAPP